MEFEPIRIKIDDTKMFSEVAFAIDSPIFIKKANSLRGRFHITEPLREDDCESWVIKNIIEAEDTGKEAAHELFEGIRDIKDCLYLSFNFLTVVEKAVFGCDILPSDYGITALVNFWLLSKYPEICPRSYREVLNSNLYAIVLTPQTRKKDVDRMYKKYIECERMDKNNPETFYFDRGWDYKGEIKRDRRWYWEKKTGMTYLQIAEHDEERKKADICPEDYQEVVRKAIKAYEKALLPQFSSFPKFP